MKKLNKGNLFRLLFCDNDLLSLFLMRRRIKRGQKNNNNKDNKEINNK